MAMEPAISPGQPTERKHGKTPRVQNKQRARGAAEACSVLSRMRNGKGPRAGCTRIAESDEPEPGASCSGWDVHTHNARSAYALD